LHELPLIYQLSDTVCGANIWYISLRILAGNIEDFPIYIKGQAFSLYLYILVVDTCWICPRDGSNNMKIALFLVGEAREEINEKLEIWTHVSETHGFRLSRSKQSIVNGETQM